MKSALLLSFLFFSSLFSQEPFSEPLPCPLLYDLSLAQAADCEMDCCSLPVTFNFLLEGGYFTTPSARMTETGDIGFGAVYSPHYWILSGMIQPFSHLEFSTAYRLFRGVNDEGLSPHGYGDFSDRGANFKFAIALPEDSCCLFPGLAVGAIDFVGTKRFRTYYVVGTQVFPELCFETSLGWGTGRFSEGPSRGIFGGVAWFPYLKSCDLWKQGLSLAAEYDPIDYKNPQKEPHPCARNCDFPVNFGLKYKFFDVFDVAASYIRGRDFSVYGSFRYNLGQTEGILPKIGDPMPYSAPCDFEPLGCYRPENVMIEHLAHKLQEQGFRLSGASIEQVGDGEYLWIRIINERYREECEVRGRMQSLLSALTPSNIDTVIVVLESYGLPCQQYVYTQELLQNFSDECITPCQLELMTPRCNAMKPCCETTTEIFYHRLDIWKGKISPRFETFLGSARGKFKYDLGLRAALEGFLPYDCFYELQVSYTLASTTRDVSDFDVYNPSQLPNVLTDYVNYRHSRNFSTDRAYIQKNWNMGRGWFSRASGGYFQVNYAGAAGEILLYPATSNIAFGIEGAILKKRRYTGLGFQDKLRKLDGYTPTYIPYTVLTQLFITANMDLPSLKMASKLSVGQFLAYDRGMRFELTRYFDSGLRISGWITFTNAGDKVHGENFYNRGIIFELPFDIFYRCSSRKVWNQGMAAWLRDAGAFVPTGLPLFDIINRERRY
jgi:hypothetical protein